MRAVRTVAAVVALATVAFAVGDLASHPNPLGALGVLVLIAAFAALLSVLFRREPRVPGHRRRGAEPPPEPEPDTVVASPRRRRPRETVWAGWDASEAEQARERRRNGR